MSTKFYVDWEDRRYLPRAAAARPTKTFFSSDPQPQNLSFGGQSIVYGHLREAHTDGDIYVRFAERNVIVAGGVVTARRYPFSITSPAAGSAGWSTQPECSSTWLTRRTLIVPDAGPGAAARRSRSRSCTMLSTVRERMEAMALEGRGVDDMIEAELTKDFDEGYSGDSALFIANAYEGMWWRMRGTVA